MSWAVLILGVVLALKTGGNVIRLWKAGGWVEEAKKEAAASQEENKQLNDQLSQVQTPQYMEREAREKLGYGKPGEIVVVLPDEVAPPSAKVSEGLQPNWVRWRKLYLGF